MPCATRYFDAPREVVLHEVAPLPVARVQELLAEARRAAEVRLEDGVAAVREELRVVAEAPARARPRAAVREDDRREVLRGNALRKREVRRDLEAVGRRVADRLHRSHVLARDALADDVLDGELLRLAIEEVDRPRVRVARGGDDPDAVVARGRDRLDLLVSDLLLQEVVVGPERLVAEVDPRPVVLVSRRDELVRRLREDRAAEIDALHRVGLDDFLRAGRGVEEQETREVGVALVRLEVDARVVPPEAVEAAGLEDGAGVHGLEAVGVHAEDLRVALVGRPLRHPENAGVVERPARDPLRVLPHERPLARRDLDLVDVVPGGVPVVQPDVDRVGVALGQRVDLGACALRVRQVARGGRLLSGFRRGGRVDGPDVVVLVAVVVLDEEDPLAVARPEEAGDGPLRLRGDEVRFVIALGRPLDPDVPRVLPGLQEGNVHPVRRQPRGGDLRVAEEQLAVEERRSRRPGERGRHDERQREQKAGHAGS